MFIPGIVYPVIRNRWKVNGIPYRSVFYNCTCVLSLHRFRCRKGHMGIQWWNGEAISQTLMQAQFARFDMRWMANFPLLAKV